MLNTQDVRARCAARRLNLRCPGHPTGEPAAQALEQLLAQCQGNVSEAACQLGISHSTIQRRIQQLQLGVRHAQWRGP